MLKFIDVAYRNNILWRKMMQTGGGVFHPCGGNSTLVSNNIVSSTLLTYTMNVNCFL